MADKEHSKKAGKGDVQPTKKSEPVKSDIAEQEENILKFWQDNDIFKKTLEKESPKGEYVFYDGPPFATGQPHYGHVLPGSIKDAIPRYKTMRGFHVPRVWGWDCHGLPVENLVEKELGLKSKKDIEEYGIEKFNEKARESVLRYDSDWKRIIPRTGRWIDMDLAYLTMNWTYSESIWWSFKTLFDKNLIYQGFKVMYVCPHCETSLANFEVTQGYKDITDISVYAKFELVDEPGTYVIAWTTTPWTLPGNVALAVNPEIQYALIDLGSQTEDQKGKIIVAADRASLIESKVKKTNPDAPLKVEKLLNAKDLVGRSYKPLFDYYVDADLKGKENAWKIYPADFVTITEGTGVVHMAPGFGEEDYNLAVAAKIPVVLHVGIDGKFKKEVTDFAGKPVKPKDTSDEPNKHQETDIEIIKLLAHKGLLFAKEKIVHSYPHCWRCDTPLLNYATSSWFVKVTDLKDKLLEENKKVHWVPQEIGEGRFGKWLEGAKDWAISRSRFWGAPLPVWICKDCDKRMVMGSVADLKAKTKRNTYYVVRHGEGDHNVENIISSKADNPHHLTEHGIEEVTLAAQAFKNKKIDVIISSPFVRTKETADIIVEQTAFKGKLMFDDRLGEFNFGDLNMQSIEKYHAYYNSVKEKLTKRLPNGECINDVRNRIGEFMYEIDATYEGKTILLVTHDGPASTIFGVAEGADDARMLDLWGMDRDFLSPGQIAELEFAELPHNKKYELDLHRPFIDAVKFQCECGGPYERVPEVFDTWYESGSMPYGQFHYPFEHEHLIKDHKQFPADFIAEGQDQTRGWFYSLLVLSTGLFGHSPYKNVIVNGIVLAEDGQKMSKRLKNYPEMTDVLDKYGADALRYYLLSSPVVRAEDLAFSEKGLDEIVKKVLLRLNNVYTFYATYAHDMKAGIDPQKSKNILDQWIMARLNEVGTQVTLGLEQFEIDRASRPFMNFIDDLSTWYLRRSRDRFKGDDEEDKQAALATTQHILFELSKLMAPFMPFSAEDVYQKVAGQNKRESVHLEDWSEFKISDSEKLLIDQMDQARKIVEVALAVRSKSGIKVRQPLNSLHYEVTVKRPELNKALENLIADELNVKNVVVGAPKSKKDTYIELESGGVKINLDIEITPELKEEGQVRDIIRSIQELRKQRELNPHDIVTLQVETDEAGEAFLKKYKAEIAKAAQLKDIVIGDTPGEKVTVDTLSFVFGIIR